MKIGKYEIANKWIGYGAICVIAVFAIFILGIPSSCQKPSDTTQIIADVKAALEKQYGAQLAAQEAQIKDYKSRLSLSEGRYAVLAIKYTDLEKRKQNVIAPTTNKEMRDRFTALGYPPLVTK
jgi:hypothetical protein